MLPVPYERGDGVIRIFFAGRNDRNHSQIGYVDIDQDFSILRMSDEPLLEPGQLGLFDDSGVFPSTVANLEDGPHLYYVGWMQAQRIRYFGSLGLARITEGGDTLEKTSRTPLLERTDIDPYMILSADVRSEDDQYQMWYTSVDGWRKTDRETVPLCHIKYAESADGRSWERTGDICIDFRDADETRIARPCVRASDDGYEMWYCHADGLEGYQLGYATSTDGMEWTRRDTEIDLLGDSGWDSEMTAYPYVFDRGEESYMLYNGNGYGESGFGYAVRL